VAVLHSGFVVYFPYHADGKTRFMRAAGPVAAKWFKQSPWTPLKKIPRTCQSALIASEDGQFFQHWGIDKKGIEHAMEKNLKRGKIRHGGSTLTQQVVKNVFLSRSKSYVRKSREAIGALMLDRIMSKHSQMEWYFNVVEFGPEQYGIDKAAAYYFKKKPQNLTPTECVALISLLPSPVKMGRALKEHRPNRQLESRANRLARLLEKNAAISSSEAAVAALLGTN